MQYRVCETSLSVNNDQGPSKDKACLARQISSERRQSHSLTFGEEEAERHYYWRDRIVAQSS